MSTNEIRYNTIILIILRNWMLISTDHIANGDLDELIFQSFESHLTDKAYLYNIQSSILFTF